MSRSCGIMVSMDHQMEQERRVDEYLGALEEEWRKILVFQRELPLCLQLITQAIESIRQKVGGGEEVTSDGPVLEEFIPLKPTSSCSEEEPPRRDEIIRSSSPERSQKKPDWLRSVKIWNEEPVPVARPDVVRKPVAVEAKKGGGAFHPFDREKRAPVGAPAAAATCSSGDTSIAAGTGGAANGGGEEKEGHCQNQSNRKARRCWSPELHRRFLHALQQLGGSHAATPKQIRELMKVDRLTNDEVKSHLQKYRLHTRRPSSAVQSSCSSTPQAPQFVVVGGIWVPASEYAAAATATATATTTAQPIKETNGPLNRVYAPVASLPPDVSSRSKKQIKRSPPPDPQDLEGRRIKGGKGSVVNDRATNSASSTSSSSSQTTTAS